MKADKWAVRINAAWQKSLDGILECGRLLAEAKEELEHGEFQAMKLPFKRSTAFRLMAIAKDEKLVAHAQHLPPSWATLYELTKLTDIEFKAKLKDGTINPDMQRKDVSVENRAVARQKDIERVQTLVARPGRYKTLVIDPPWKSDWLSESAQDKIGYATMTHEELLALDVGQWAEDKCHLYLWSTNNFLVRATELMLVWGFSYRSTLVWIKPRLGLGQYFRNTVEFCLFGTRGDIGTKATDIPTHFEAEIGEHSQKPEQLYQIVRKASFEPFGEIFQREARADFTNLYVDVNATEADEWEISE